MTPAKSATDFPQRADPLAVIARAVRSYGDLCRRIRAYQDLTRLPVRDLRALSHRPEALARALDGEEPRF